MGEIKPAEWVHQFRRIFVGKGLDPSEQARSAGETRLRNTCGNAKLY